MSNIHKIVEKCKRVGFRNIFVSSLVYATRVSLPYYKEFIVWSQTIAVKMLTFILITEISEGFVYIRIFIRKWEEDLL